MKNRAIEEIRLRMAGKPVKPVQFLKSYWHKRPLLIRGAFANWQDPVTANELAGLACEEGVESRLVMERGGSKPWQVTHGPQKASRLRRLPRSHWTLLVQSVDRWIPGVSALLDPFRFIPDWRVDDVMISFAPRAGTVGPHLDSYDVFLIQGQGRRRWQVDAKAPVTLKPGLDLRILKQFRATEEWVLGPGDMLYLPPHLAHYGVALEDCLTYSVGFRSPNAMRLLADAQARLMESQLPEERYSDPELKPAVHPGEIPRASLSKLRQLMERALDRLTEADFNAMVGELLTDPKEAVPAAWWKVTADAVRSRFHEGARLTRTPGSRMGFIRQNPQILLYANGQRFPLEPTLAFAAPLLTGSRTLSAAELAPHLKKTTFVELLVTLLKLGAFTLER